MSYWHPQLHTMHPALLAHHEQARHRLVSDPVDVAPGGAVAPLTYHGGPTMKDPKVTLLYAGQFWDDKDAVNAFLRAVVEDGYADAARGQGTKPGTFLGAFDIAAPTSAAMLDQDCRTLLRSVVGQNGIPAPDANTLFMLALPEGVQVAFTAGGDRSCEQFCGYHSNDELSGVPLLYAVHPATICGGCYQVNPRTGLQMVLAHEFIEAATDPTGAGWFNDQDGSENADEAAWVQDQYGQWVTQGYAAQNAAGQWVNSIGGYVAPVPQPQPHFKPSGDAADAWAQLEQGGALAKAELTLLLGSDPSGPAAPAWRYLLQGGSVQALLDSGWGAWFHGRGAA